MTTPYSTVPPSYTRAWSFDTSPKFSYVAKLTAEQRQAAQKEAFAQAKAEAAELAEAAGMELGPVATLRQGIGWSQPTPPGYCAPCAQPVKSAGEVESANFARATISVSVSTTFHLISPARPQPAAP